MKKLTEEQLQMLRKFKRAEDRRYKSPNEKLAHVTTENMNGTAAKSLREQILELDEKCKAIIRNSVIGGKWNR